MAFEFGPRRAQYFDISEVTNRESHAPTHEVAKHYDSFDLIYRSLCAAMYNYVPMSGHPGGSISSGRAVAGILFDAMEYDLADPQRDDADMISYAAGHKALGLYAMWAMRNEVARIGAPELLPKDERLQMRLEDLLGFRRNPVTATPLYKQFNAKPLDGHPTPATPFVRLSTGASGVGVSTSLGLAFGAKDYFGADAPLVHIVEGEGGMTPGRVVEAMAAAGTASLGNTVMHLDWNQASIDSNKVCRDGDVPGDYVQWDPMELAYLHDWNVVFVPDGKDIRQVLTAQRFAATIDNDQPTIIVYRTIKGYQYGIEGRASHGAGHKLCSDGFYDALNPMLGERTVKLPTCCDLDVNRCSGANGADIMEECFWASLGIIRKEMEQRPEMIQYLAGRLTGAKDRLDKRGRKPREAAPKLEAAYEMADREGKDIPAGLRLEPGSKTTLRGELGKVLNRYNKVSGGAFFAAAADLLGSTSVNVVGDGFGEGFYHAQDNAGSRLLSIGGICEDAMAGIMSGLGAYGKHIGAASSYGAFLAPLGHIAARLHAIGNQARQAVEEGPYRPMILVCAHTGLKTGEDGPTHADPQALQLLQENFPQGTSITLTPFDPAEMWTLMSVALQQRPAVITPFVTRPAETVPNRERLGLAPATASRTGVYLLREAKEKNAGTVVLQGSGVTLDFVNYVLPRLIEAGIDLNVYYVASAELFDVLPAEEQERIFPEARAQEAMGITGFTLPTMYRWVRSTRGRELTMHPFQHGHFLGSGQADKVLAEAGLDGEGQYKTIRKYLDQMVKV